LALVAIQWFEPGGSEESAPQVAIAPALQSDILHAGMRWDTGEPEVAHLLNTYLIEHNEFMPSSSIRGVMSYGRFVGYDSSPREQR
jgi:hypothetical protein